MKVDEKNMENKRMNQALTSALCFAEYNVKYIMNRYQQVARQI